MAAKKVVKTVKTETAKAEAVKTSAAKVETAKTEVPKATEVKAPVVKDTSDKTEKVEKEEAKPAVKKETKEAVKKPEVRPEVYIQYQNREIIEEDIFTKIKDQYVSEGHRLSSIKTLQVYLKPEEGAAYYVINHKTAGRVDMF